MTMMSLIHRNICICVHNSSRDQNAGLKFEQLQYTCSTLVMKLP